MESPNARRTTSLVPFATPDRSFQVQSIFPLEDSGAQCYQSVHGFGPYWAPRPTIDPSPPSSEVAPAPSLVIKRARGLPSSQSFPFRQFGFATYVEFVSPRRPPHHSPARPRPHTVRPRVNFAPSPQWGPGVLSSAAYGAWGICLRLTTCNFLQGRWGGGDAD